jgi:hypothetical protein
MQKIGLLMVVRNEAHRLPAFFEHTLPYVDAVAIADQRSDDGTWELIQKYKEKSTIPFEAWQDEKHGISEPSKQPTADLLATDWILYLDPDEIAEERFLKEMHELVEENEVDGYTLIRKNIFLVRVFGDNTPIEPKILRMEHPTLDRQVRLTRKMYSFFPPQIHVRVRVRRQRVVGYHENIQHTDYEIIHEKTIKEQFEDDKRYEKPVKKVQEQIENDSVVNW